MLELRIPPRRLPALNTLFGADLLDSVISTAAGQAGFAYAEVRGGFTGHEICAPAAGCTRWTG